MKRKTYGIIKFFTPLVATVFITIICAILLLPFPWQQQPLFYAGDTSGKEISFQGNVEFKNIFGIIVTSVGLPSKLNYYNFHLKFKGTKDSPRRDASVLRFAIKKDTEFWNYVSSALGTPSMWLDSTVVGTYEISVGREINIRGIPIGVAVNYSSGLVECGFTKEGPCPPDISDMESMIDAYTSPNLLALFIQWLLIFSFWVVVVNSFLDLIHQKWRTD
jgi:hypothetical protein